MAKSMTVSMRASAAQVLSHVHMPLYQNGDALILSSGTTSVLGLAYWFLAARYYSTEAVGLNSAAISAMTLLSTVSLLNLNGGLIRFVPMAGRATKKLMVYSYLDSLILGAIVSFLFGIGLSVSSPARSFIGSSPAVLLWFVLATMSWTVFTLQDYVLMGLRKTVWIPIENTTVAAAKIVLLVIFARGMGSYGIFASLTIPVAISLLPINVLIFRYLIPKHMEAAPEESTSIPLEPIVKFIAGNYLGVLFL